MKNLLRVFLVVLVGMAWTPQVVQAGSLPTLPSAMEAEAWQDASPVISKEQLKMEKKMAKLERKAAKKKKGDRSWLLAVLLAFFLGGLGIDRFYLGYTGIGLIKLFTAGLFGILWVVDFFLILFGLLGPKNGSY